MRGALLLLLLCAAIGFAAGLDCECPCEAAEEQAQGVPETSQEHMTTTPAQENALDDDDNETSSELDDFVTTTPADGFPSNRNS